MWDIDADLGKSLHKNEEKLTNEIVRIIADGVRAQYLSGQRAALRDAHPKAHGCVTATFKVNDNLPPDLAQGVFAPGKTYQAVIRFSNGNADPMLPDAKPDARGMAIKLLDVPGDKILPNERNALTQDFVMINHPVFFLDDPATYLRLQKLQHKPPNALQRVMLALTHNHELLEGFAAFLALSPKVGIKSARLILKVAGSKISSPLRERYWSMSAYRLGDPPHKLAIKFSARPTRPREKDTIPTDPSPNYLRETMIEQLATDDWQFAFELQRKPPNMSVENTMVEWPDSEPSHFEPVATITIPKQKFATLARDQFCEGLSFTPWHALPQHRPLGAVNRMRRVAYEKISQLRHKLNGVQSREPTERDVP